MITQGVLPLASLKVGGLFWVCGRVYACVCKCVPASVHACVQRCAVVLVVGATSLKVCGCVGFPGCVDVCLHVRVCKSVHASVPKGERGRGALITQGPLPLTSLGVRSLAWWELNTAGALVHTMLTDKTPLTDEQTRTLLCCLLGVGGGLCGRAPLPQEAVLLAHVLQVDAQPGEERGPGSSAIVDLCRTVYVCRYACMHRTWTRHAYEHTCTRSQCGRDHMPVMFPITQLPTPSGTN